MRNKMMLVTLLVISFLLQGCTASLKAEPVPIDESVYRFSQTATPAPARTKEPTPTADAAPTGKTKFVPDMSKMTPTPTPTPYIDGKEEYDISYKATNTPVPTATPTSAPAVTSAVVVPTKGVDVTLPPAETQKPTETPTPSLSPEPTSVVIWGTSTPVPSPTSAVFRMPNVNGYTYDDAVTLLRTLAPNLKISFKTDPTSASAEGHVIGQYPAAGADALTDASVVLTVAGKSTKTATPTPTPKATATSTPWYTFSFPDVPSRSSTNKTTTYTKKTVWYEDGSSATYVTYSWGGSTIDVFYPRNESAEHEGIKTGFQDTDHITHLEFWDGCSRDIDATGKITDYDEKGKKVSGK
jgi:hypothetical protein